jgi:hypothetical protein
MQIDKIIIIESPVHLWKILLAKEEIIDQSKDDDFFFLNLFMDFVNNYINGCKCDEEENYMDMIDQYNNLIQNEDIISYLTKCFECDRIEFK